MIKPTGNSILIEPTPDADGQLSPGGIVMVNHYKKTNLKWRVLAVGPGEWVYSRNRKKRHWEQPEVQAGDLILSRCLLDGAKYQFEDGTGRVIIKGGDAMMVWREKGAETEVPAPVN
jgi:co-chaperonin GroES (HSP10)